MNVNYWEYKIAGKTGDIVEVIPGSLFYLKKIIVAKLLNTANASICGKDVKSVKNIDEKTETKKTEDIELDIFFLDNEKNLLTGDCLDSFAEKFGRSTDLKPVLTIGEVELIDIGHKQDRRHLFFDSSICYNYIPNIHLGIIEKALDRIIQNYTLFSSQIIKEHQEFQSRLVKNSKLISDGAHATEVSPFVFHSEHKMHVEATIIRRGISDKGYCWHCLLVDDYAEIDLRGVEKSGLTKKKILEDALNKDESFHIVKKYTERKKDAVNIKISTVTEGTNNENIIIKALTKLSEKTYDIILLDYLLGENTNEDNRREYSHELLNILNLICKQEYGYGGKNNFEVLAKKIHKTPEETEEIVHGILKHKGPLTFFWFLNISSFSNAFLERLREQGLGHNTSYWYLSRGGDMVNTPNLFIYALLSMMQLQLSKSIFNLDSILDFIDKTILDGIKTFDQFQAVMGPEYAEFIQRFGSRPLLFREKEKSLFARSVCEEFYEDISTYNKRMSRLVSTLQSFNHLCAYGTESDLENMRYYLFSIKQVLEEIKYLHQQSESDSNQSKKIETIVENLKHFDPILNGDMNI